MIRDAVRATEEARTARLTMSAQLDSAEPRRDDMTGRGVVDFARHASLVTRWLLSERIATRLNAAVRVRAVRKLIGVISRPGDVLFVDRIAYTRDETGGWRARQGETRAVDDPLHVLNELRDGNFSNVRCDALEVPTSCTLALTGGVEAEVRIDPQGRITRTSWVAHREPRSSSALWTTTEFRDFGADVSIPVAAAPAASSGHD